MAYSTAEFGTCYTSNYRMYIQKDSNIVSPFHDIPLFHDECQGIVNMIVEIPRWTNAKMEICTKGKMNPIKQDIKKGNVRFVKNSFPFRGYIWNYGAFPQTWEDPDEDEHTHHKGDGDPIDVVDIGYKVSYRGEIKQVKVLGIMAMIDEGETDWKVIAIDINDPLASKLHDIDDVSKEMPGLIEATREWFRTYKMPGAPDAKPNKFAFNGKAKNKQFALDIIKQTHGQWKKAVMNKAGCDKISCDNVSVVDSPHKIDECAANAVTKDLPIVTDPAPLPDDVDMMYYLSAERKMGSSD